MVCVCVRDIFGDYLVDGFIVSLLMVWRYVGSQGVLCLCPLLM